METNNITKVAILPDGCLGVFPERKEGMFQHIYREAAGVYWDQEYECFKSTPPKEWNYGKWYTQILTVVASGLGFRLLMTPETKIESDEEGFEDIIKRADMVFYR